MSLGDILSSGRGPGFIGMMLALMVLAGFGLLYLAVADVEAASGESVQAIVKRQVEEIEGCKLDIESGNFQLETAAILEDINENLETLKAGAAGRVEKLEKLRDDLASVKKSVADTATAYSSYKDQYRSSVRNAAVGETLETLTLKSGSIYRKVEIRGISAVGVQIRHEDGQKRVAFEDLPNEMLVRFQFDQEQKDKQLAEELENLKRHEAAVNDTPLAPVPDAEAAPADAEAAPVPVPAGEPEVEPVAGNSKQDDIRKAQKKRAVSDLQIRIARARTEYSALINEATEADNEAASGNRDRTAVVTKAAGIRTRMQAKQTEIAALMRQLSAVKSAQ